MKNLDPSARPLSLLLASQLLSACTSHDAPAPSTAAATNPGVANIQGPTAPNQRDSTEPNQRHSPEQLVDALHTAFGNHRARAVHAKGIILEGVFTPDLRAATLTTAFHLQNRASIVTVRFSNFTGLPDIPDTSPSANPRGIALKFTMPDGSTTDIVGHSFNGFPTSTSDDFRDLLLAIAASGPDAAKPTTLDGFLESHPVAKTFLTTQKTPASYATITYYGVNSFEFTNARGESRYVRYQFVPEGGEQLLTPEQSAKSGAAYLRDGIKARIATGPFRFAYYAQLAEPGDRIADPSIAWPDTRTRVLLGTIEVRSLAPNTVAEDRALSFSPTNLPDRIKPADPMLTFRAHAYPISVKERQ
jgi:catalase